MSESESRVVSSEEFALLTARPETRILFICVTVFIVALAQGFRDGWLRNALILAVGAVISILGMLLFRGSLTSRRRSWTAAASALAAFAPFLFGCYLLFYRGAWNGRLLLADFSAAAVFATAAFAYLGYRLVYWTWRLTEIGDALRTGRLIVSDATQPAA